MIQFDKNMFQLGLTPPTSKPLYGSWNLKPIRVSWFMSGLNVAVASMLACSDARFRGTWLLVEIRDGSHSKTRCNTEISCSSGDGATEYIKTLLLMLNHIWRLMKTCFIKQRNRNHLDEHIFCNSLSRIIYLTYGTTR